MKNVMCALCVVGLLILLAPTASLGQENLAESIVTMMDAVNAKMEAEGLDYRVGMAELLTLGESGQIGITVYSTAVGNKQAPFHFVPFDERRSVWSGSVDGETDDITYAVDQTADATPLPGSITSAQATTAIDNAMDTWDEARCSTLPINRVNDWGLDLGPTAWFSLSGSPFSCTSCGTPFVVADIMHAGWGDWLGLLDPWILAVTYTWGLVDGSGQFTDIDNNGKLDTAFSDIYYNTTIGAFPFGLEWKIDDNVDVETIALHEVGHALSQTHFGSIFVVGSTGALHIAPRAVMNEIYFGVQQSLLGTDLSGHCSIWGSWPNE